MELAGRNALVTGASGGGIGRAIAMVLAEEGAKVALHYHSNQTGAERLAEELNEAGHQTCVVQGDLANRDDPVTMCKAAEKRIGSIDILINSGGHWVEKPLLETTDEEWDSMLHTDLRGTFLTIRTLAPGMIARRWGRIINISSIASLNYIRGEGAYGVSKVGINMLTKAFGAELGPHGVTVNAVAPGWTLGLDQPYPPRPSDYPQCAQVPDGRPGHAREVAAIVRFLVSDNAAHINCQILGMDGGISAILPKGR